MPSQSQVFPDPMRSRMDGRVPLTGKKFKFRTFRLAFKLGKLSSSFVDTDAEINRGKGAVYIPAELRIISIDVQVVRNRINMIDFTLRAFYMIDLTNTFLDSVFPPSVRTPHAARTHTTPD
jgi:hypothetical protein